MPFLRPFASIHFPFCGARHLADAAAHGAVKSRSANVPSKDIVLVSVPLMVEIAARDGH